MKITMLLPGFLSCLFFTPALAGGFDILGQPIDALFETGRYFELGLGIANPQVAGQITAVGPPFYSGDTAPTLPFYTGAALVYFALVLLGSSLVRAFTERWRARHL